MSDTTFEAGEVAELTRVVDGRAVRYLSRGSGPDIVLFLHSGQPGIPPFAGSSVLFESTLQSVRLDGYRLIAPDLPGAGGTALRGLEDLTVRGVTRAVSALLAGLGPVGSIHIVAQGAAGLPAMKMAREGVAGVLPSSVMLIGANTAAPTGDAIQNVALLNPAVPIWGRRFHHWAMRRLAYWPSQVPERIIDRLVLNAEGSPHVRAQELVANVENASSLFGDAVDERDQLYAHFRDHISRIPISLVWGAFDPTVGVPRGSALAQVFKGSVGHLDFNVINQASHFVQFDRPLQFARMVENHVRFGSHTRRGAEVEPERPGKRAEGHAPREK